METTCQFGGTVDPCGVRRLQVGLVEGREQPVGVVRFEVGIEVVAAVEWIPKTVQATAVGTVGMRESDLDGVRSGSERIRRQGQEVAVVGNLVGPVVDANACQGSADEIDRQRMIGIAEGEADHNPAGVLLHFAVEFELEVVGHVVDPRRTGLGMTHGEHRRRHARLGCRFDLVQRRVAATEKDAHGKCHDQAIGGSDHGCGLVVGGNRQYCPTSDRISEQRHPQ